MNKPVEWEDVLLGIRHHLDDGTSERKEVYDRLLAIEKEIKKRGSRSSRGLARYLVAICIGVAATLAWQSYGEELGWSPEVKQIIVVQTLPAAVVPKAPTASTIDPEQVNQIALDLGALRQTVDQLAASQDQMVHQIDTLQTSNQEILTSNQEILEKIPAPPPPPPAVAPTGKPATRTPSSRAPIPRP
jgi:hypothetical protein